MNDAVPARRVRRTRSVINEPSTTLLADARTPIDEFAYESNRRLQSYHYDDGISDVALAITKECYPHFLLNRELKFPEDFASRSKDMNQEIRRACYRVANQCLYALGTHWIGTLRPLDYKMLVFILGRSWYWLKPREAIPYSEFRDGFYFHGECGQMGVGGNDRHLANARGNLIRMRLIRSGVTKASWTKNPRYWYEIDVATLLAGAQAMRDSTETRTTWKERLYPP